VIVRDQLVSVQPEDLNNDDILLDKATYFYTVFSTLATLQNSKITDTRKRNLAEKRQEKRINPTFITPVSSHTWVGPPAPPLTAAETAQRIASIQTSRSLGRVGLKALNWTGLPKQANWTDPTAV
jgi:hypothetical protein